MTADEFRATLDRLKLSQLGAAKAMRVDPRTVRRWALGERDIPEIAVVLLAYMERFGQL